MAVDGKALVLPARIIKSTQPMSAVVARMTMVAILAIGPGYLLSKDWLVAAATSIISLPLIFGSALMFMAWQTERQNVNLPLLSDESRKETLTVAAGRKTWGFRLICVGLFFGLLAWVLAL